MNRPAKYRGFINDNGFALTELLQYVTLSGVVLSGIFLVFNQAIAMYADTVRSSVVVQDVQRVSDILERETGSIKGRTHVLVATSGQFKFTNHSNLVVDLVYAGGQIRRNNVALMSGVTSFSFQYYKWDGSVWTAASPTSAIAKVRYAYSTTHQGYVFNCERTVLLRNMR